MADVPAAIRRRLAADLLAIDAVALAPDHPFTWASGRKAPIYCDNRLTLAYPAVRRRIRDGFAQLAQALGLAPEVIAGTATAGIPHAAWLADLLELPLVYVRSQPKAHGRRNQIEGRLDAGQRVVLIEDLISTGGSSLDAVAALRDAGAEVLAVLGIFTYGLPAARAAFEAAGVPLHTLTSYEVLLDVAAEAGPFDAEALAVLRSWQQDPAAWSDARS